MAYTTETYFLTILEAGKSKVKVSADSVPGERTVFGLGEDAFLLYPRVAENKRGGISLFFLQGHNPVLGTPPSDLI